MHMPPHPISPVCSRHRGVTFTEVMFAVVVLGIGFIMLAAIFPVAIMQTKTSLEQTQGAALSRSALRYMEQVGTLTDNGNPAKSLLEVTDGGVVGSPAKVVAITNNPAASATAQALFHAASGDMIRADDPRYAFIPLYRRATVSITVPFTANIPAPYAQVFVFAVQIRATDNHPGGTYNVAQDVLRPTTTTLPAVLEPRVAQVTLKYVDGTDNNVIEFTAGSESVGEGSYVIIADGTSSGRIYRIGSLLTGDPSTGKAKWQLAPGYELKSDNSEDVATATAAYVVGKQLQNPTQAFSASNPYINIVQDVGCYTTFVRVN
jgi:Tfp pilus assembly protein PilV